MDVIVSGLSGEVLDVWTGPQAATSLARGEEPSVGRAPEPALRLASAGGHLPAPVLRSSDFWASSTTSTTRTATNETLRLRGGLTIHGGAFVDGPGGIDVGSNRVNITYDEKAFISISSYGSASIVQNSWRDITGG